MPTRQDHEAAHSPPPSDVKVCFLFRHPPPPPSSSVTVHYPPKAPPDPRKDPGNKPGTSSRRVINQKAPILPLPPINEALRAPRPRADFGPPNVPIQPSQKHPIHPQNSLRSTSHPLRESSRVPSANIISEWKKSSTKLPNTRMNPKASTFAPKPTYAQSVKASLPQRSASAGKVPSKSRNKREAGAVAMDEKPTLPWPIPRHLPGEGWMPQRAHRESPHGSGVGRHHEEYGPPLLFPNPLAPRQGQTRHPHEWHPNWQTHQHHMPFPNPLLGYGPHPPMPPGEYLPPGYYHPQLYPGSLAPWGPAAGAAWEEHHRSQGSPMMYGPFPPPAHVALPEMHHPPHMPFTFPLYPPDPGWTPVPPMYTGGFAPPPPPEPARRSPSKGKRHQMAREVHRRQSRDRTRAAAWRIRNSNNATPVQPLPGSYKPSAVQSLAQSVAEPQQEPSPRREKSPFAPKIQVMRREPDAPSRVQERGRSRYRLISTKAKVHQDANRRAQRTSSDSSDSALMFGDDKVDSHDISHLTKTPESNSKALVLREQPPSPSLTPVKADGPPPNAPTGPASLRRFPNLQKNRTSLIHKPAEQGSWSQSKRWVSQETKERTAFSKLMHNLHYMGADKSPFLPNTPAELTKFKVAQVDRISKGMAANLHRLEERRRRRRTGQEEGTLGDGDEPELFQGRNMTDNLSPFFASESCFNAKLPPKDSGLEVDWPSRQELKEEGDRRAARYGRYFPLPRLNIVATRIQEEENEHLYSADGTITWEKKAVKHCSRFIRPVTSELDPPHYEDVRFDLQELHEALQDLLDEIDGFGWNEEDAQGKGD